ncbi:hypothetical protein EVA_17877 [gut metagenome]|uniref:Uncharacterized protein n=1 Tax=gut metagenome TaxID=749906 RepID=J9C2F9_9ZZZZ
MAKKIAVYSCKSAMRHCARRILKTFEIWIRMSKKINRKKIRLSLFLSI